jgi:hypothetical protein
VKIIEQRPRTVAFVRGTKAVAARVRAPHEVEARRLPFPHARETFEPHAHAVAFVLAPARAREQPRPLARRAFVGAVFEREHRLFLHAGERVGRPRRQLRERQVRSQHALRRRVHDERGLARVPEQLP